MYAILAFWILTLGIGAYVLLDGKIRPVTTQLEIVDIQPLPKDNGDAWFLVVGNFEKIRNCKLVAVRWYLGNRIEAKSVGELPVPTLVGPIPTNFSPPTNLETGDQTSKYLRVRLEPRLIKSNSYAYVFHRCYGPHLWKTRTLFYESELDSQNSDADS